MTRTALAALAAAAAVFAAPAAARAADPADAAVQACVDSHPGAVTEKAVEDSLDGMSGDGGALAAQDNLVCVGRYVVGSPGDDTYLVVPGTAGITVPHVDNESPDLGKADPGTDTLSLADWTEPYSGSGPVNMLSLLDTPEVQVLTPLGDVINPADEGRTCNDLTASDAAIRTGAGSDAVYCVAVATVSTGTGADEVTGTGGSQVVRLGPGADQATVTGGGADTVRGGAGSDTVARSGNDTVYSAHR
jgi:hypothetical protein